MSNRDRYESLIICVMLTLALFLLIAFATRAQELPDSPKPKIVDKPFVITMSILGASAAADYVTTSRLPSYAHETNPLLGRHPSNARIAAVGASYFAGEVALSYGLKRIGMTHRKLRWLWRIEPGFAIGNHAVLAWRNTLISEPTLVCTQAYGGVHCQ